MKRDRHLLRQTEFYLLVFCLFFLLVNWPFLAISGKNGLLSIFLYLHVLWAILILLLFLIQRSGGNDSDSGADEEGGD